MLRNTLARTTARPASASVACPSGTYCNTGATSALPNFRAISLGAGPNMEVVLPHRHVKAVLLRAASRNNQRPCCRRRSRRESRPRSSPRGTGSVQTPADGFGVGSTRGPAGAAADAGARLRARRCGCPSRRPDLRHGVVDLDLRRASPCCGAGVAPRTVERFETRPLSVDRQDFGRPTKVAADSAPASLNAQSLRDVRLLRRARL